MTIECPYCQHTTALKAVRPGRFTSACPKCSRKFLIAIPDDPSGVPSVTKLRAEQGGGASESAARAKTPPTDPQPTGDWTPPARTEATQPAGRTGVTQPGATAARTSAPAETQALTDPQATRDAIGGDPTAPADELGFDVASGRQGAPSDDAGARPEGVPATLGGYQLVKELGRGGMGAVYLARQLSLDRNVALKVMRPEWASNPTFVSRFTREAYAAAQLVHHNVVQIYDFGEDHGTSYFSMEFVRGQTLAQLVQKQKKLDPEVAVGFVLQAARGLKFAHDQSMIHRDIKPENLLLNDQGVVKVADLGLVKTPELVEAEEADAAAPASAPAPEAAGRGLSAASGQVTRVGVAMGTPAFMAPEQGRDAARVNARADIYSLGCMLYALVTGRPPFEGKSALELISKHQSEPIVPPEAIVKRVPKALSEIILKMVAKRPEDRYADLGQVIKALEDYLGVSSTAPFSPREEHANLLAECVEAFDKAPTAKLRPLLVAGGLAACALFVLIALIARRPLLSVGFLGLVPMTALAYFVVHGLTQRTFLFLKARELAFGNSLTDWLTALAVVVLFVTVLVVFHLLWPWLALAVLAIVLALALHFGVDKRIEAERRGPVEDVEQMLKKMRLQGLEEEVLRQFVCKYSGERWEEFYEELFGYEAKLVARDRWGRGDRARPRKKYAAWREPIIAWTDARRKARREAREQRLLQKVEERSLEAQGVNLVTARRKAQRAAEAMVATASEMRSAAAASAAASRADRRAISQALRQAAEAPEKVLVVRERGLLYGRRTSGPLSLVFGPRPRFLVGIALLAGCLLWMHQNKMISGEQVKAAAESAVKTRDLGALRGVEINLDRAERTRPLQIPLLPRRVRALIDFNAGAAGLILVISALFRGVGVGLLAIVGAAVALFNLLPASLLAFIPLGARWANMVAGAALAVLGILFGRGRV